MLVSVLMKFLYTPPVSVVITAMSVMNVLSMSNAGWMEVKGKNMQYSKLLRVDDDKAKEKPRVSGKVGMIAVYTPAFLAGVFSLVAFPLGDLRFTLLRGAITTHFFKRLVEVLFVHKYSAMMETEAMFVISTGYFLSSATMIYTQQLMLQLQEPSIDLKYIGVALFLVGIAMVFSMLLNFLYPPPASAVITAISAICLLAMINGGWMEVKGKNMQYSKLLRVDDTTKEKPKVSVKLGMIGAYTPAFLAGVFSLLAFPIGDLRFALLRAAITLHFFKRLLEVLFVHKMSAMMEIEAMFVISTSYFLSSAAMIYTQQLMLQLQEPPIDLKYIGVTLFLVGIGGGMQNIKKCTVAHEFDHQKAILGGILGESDEIDQSRALQLGQDVEFGGILGQSVRGRGGRRGGRLCR
ncbi:hypothetical protein SASPL_136750 [Salvia splendens]|uniref:Uncharacterized protein n=1 Tax=Salvia splendens TaxID=180675 RepID=A0A8X8ZGR3_SALSN|nr:hypothetical protein SASPL_136750 [Salvia splendens]